MSAVNLSVWFLLPDILVTPELLAVGDRGGQAFPAPGSTRVVWFAFLGSYLWGLRFALRRYLLNDLIPGAYYSIAMRMIFAGTIAFLVFNAFSAFSDTDSVYATSVWPAFAFLIGTFPQQGMHWLTERIPAFSQKPNPTVRILPLSMIEGIDPPDEARLEELGIDSCHDLANADFFPIFIQSEFNARQIVDWILQAKLCVYCGDSIKGLREHGICTILDLQHLTDESEELANLARQTAASEDSLVQSRNHAKGEELTRLMYIGGMLGQFTPVAGGQASESDGAND